MTSKKPIYLAVDSDILRTLTYFDVLRKEHGYIDVEKIKDRSLKKDFNYYNRLFNCILHDEIRLLIVDAVYQESKHSATLLNFIKEYCYFPNVNAANYQEKAERARTLAKAYCEPYTYKAKLQAAPMKSVFVADINKYVPTNDCYIMAQATVEQCSLLTANGKDFIFNTRHTDNKAEHERVLGIVQINIQNGYYVDSDKGYQVAPKPVMIDTLAKILKYDVFETTEQIDDKVKADLVL